MRGRRALDERTGGVDALIERDGDRDEAAITQLGVQLLPDRQVFAAASPRAPGDEQALLAAMLGERVRSAGQVGEREVGRLERAQARPRARRPRYRARRSRPRRRRERPIEAGRARRDRCRPVPTSAARSRTGTQTPPRHSPSGSSLQPSPAASASGSTRIASATTVASSDTGRPSSITSTPRVDISRAYAARRAGSRRASSWAAGAALAVRGGVRGRGGLAGASRAATRAGCGRACPRKLACALAARGAPGSPPRPRRNPTAGRGSRHAVARWQCMTRSWTARLDCAFAAAAARKRSEPLRARVCAGEGSSAGRLGRPARKPNSAGKVGHNRRA